MTLGVLFPKGTLRQGTTSRDYFSRDIFPGKLLPDTIDRRLLHAHRVNEGERSIYHSTSADGLVTTPLGLATAYLVTTLNIQEALTP